MSGQLGQKGLTSERLHQVLDLCLSCKACKSECPSNVDMSKMKGDTLQMYYDEHGITLRDRLTRDSSRAASYFSGNLSGLINFVQKTKLFRFSLQKIAGFDKRRVLPGYAKETFYHWFEKEHNNTYRNSKKVVLFADTYLNFHEPQIGISAVQLLNSCGYEVIVANVGCCQRPKISHGFLRLAKKEGAKTIEGLKKYMDQGLMILVCEPSCASALTDDLADLIEDDAVSAQLQKQVMLIDDFFAKEIESGNLKTAFETGSEHILFHGHCHQKALYSTKGLKMILSLTGQNFAEIPSGCCGMAGAFGYEKEHYDLSKKIGEEILFPAIRSITNGAAVIANGFSCRHQIEHFTGVKAKHWVEVIKVKQ